MTTGSFYNNLYGGRYSEVDSPVPAIGMGATRLMWTDRKACTIVAILARDKQGRPTKIEIQEDRARRTDKNGASDSQAYEYEVNLEGRLGRYSLRQNGAWVRVGANQKTGERLLIGNRLHYHDYTF
jgi:hypothetical protein